MYIDFKEALDIELKDLHYLEKRHDLAPKRWYEMYGFLIIPIEWNYCIKTQFNRIFGDFPTKEGAEEYILLYLKITIFSLKFLKMKEKTLSVLQSHGKTEFTKIKMIGVCI